MPSQFLAWNAGTQPSPTHCARFPNSPLVAGRGCTIAATIHQGVKTDTDAKVLKANLSLNWTGPYNAHAVGLCPSADTQEGSPLGSKLFYLDLHSDMPGVAHRRVSIQRC